MADKEVTALTAAVALTGNEAFHVVQGGNSRKATPAQVRTYVDNAVERDLVKSAFGALIGVKIIEEELTLSGASVTSTLKIPNRSICLGVASRTTQAVTGAPSYGVGVAGETTKFGGSLGAALGSSNVGVIGPTAFYADTSVVITPTSGTFSGGKVRVSIYVLTFGGPTG